MVYSRYAIPVMESMESRELFSISGFPAWTSSTQLRGVVITPEALAANYASGAPNVLGGLGVNILRVELVRLNTADDTYYNANDPRFVFDTEASHYRNWLMKEMNLVKSVLPRLRADKIGVILDLHTPFGGPIWGEAGMQAIFSNERIANEDLADLSFMAKTFALDGEIIAIDMDNEPNPDDPAKWNSFALKGVASIRNAGGFNATRTIIVESVGANPDMLSKLRPKDLNDKNVVYSVHLYLPTKFTDYTRKEKDFKDHPNDPHYPAPAKADEVFTDAMKAHPVSGVDDTFARVRRWQVQNAVPIYVGEFRASLLPDSSTRRKQSVADYLKYVTDRFESYGWQWTYHAFGEASVWDLQSSFVEKRADGSIDKESLWKRSGLKDKWKANARVVSSASFQLKLAANAKVLDADANYLGNGGRVQLWDNLNRDNQRWRFESNGDDTYVIRNVQANRVLDADLYGINSNGDRVQLWDYVGGLNQRWRIVAVGDGTFQILNAMSNKALTPGPNVSVNGDALQIYDYSGSTTQRFGLKLIN